MVVPANHRSFSAQTFTNTNGQFYFYILDQNELQDAEKAGLSVIDTSF
jgi:hypothetical protein